MTMKPAAAHQPVHKSRPGVEEMESEGKQIFLAAAIDTKEVLAKMAGKAVADKKRIT